MKVLNDQLLIERDKADDTTAGGIILPDIAKKQTRRGKVLAVGPGKLDVKTGDRTPVQVKPGERVVFGRYAGEEVEFEGKKLFFLRESDVHGVEVA